jgi:hypothetical protein
MNLKDVEVEYFNVSKVFEYFLDFLERLELLDVLQLFS